MGIQLLPQSYVFFLTFCLRIHKNAITLLSQTCYSIQIIIYMYTSVNLSKYWWWLGEMA